MDWFVSNHTSYKFCIFWCVISLSSFSPGCCEQTLSFIIKASLFKMSVDSNHAVSLKMFGSGWLISVLGFINRSSQFGRSIGSTINISRSVGYQCLLGQKGAMRIIWQWYFFMCCRIFGIRHIGGYAYANMFCHDKVSASMPRALGLLTHEQ